MDPEARRTSAASRAGRPSSGLFGELRRRNVFRVAAAYAVVAWLLVQAADILLGNFGAPDWVFKSFVALVALGFPLALFLSWAYELTPDGVKRAEAVTPADASAPGVRRSFDLLIVVGMAAIITLLLADRFRGVPDEAVGEAVDEAAARAELTAPPEDLPDGSPPPDALPPLQAGIAVLPFANLSPDPDNAFFANGVQEDLLTFLSRVPELRVISRTSVEQYRGTTLSVPEIGRQLDASHVLEGSVRRVGDRVRVTVQLIETASDRHLWAEHYDRDLADVFAIQTEIARTVSGQLRVRLSPGEERAVAAVDTSPDVYDLYLRARAAIANVSYRDFQGVMVVVSDLQRAVELDPDYLPAWEELLRICALLEWQRYISEPLCAEQLEPALGRIRALAVDPAIVTLAEARYRYYVQYDLRGALEMLTALVAAQPSHIDALNLKAVIEQRLGLWEQAIDTIESSVNLDPANPASWRRLWGTYWVAARFDRALQVAAEAIERFPDRESLYMAQAMLIKDHTGDRSRYLALVPGLRHDLRHAFDNAVLLDGVFETADAAIEWLEEAAPPDLYTSLRAQFNLALRLMFEGREEEALARIGPVKARLEEFIAELDDFDRPETRDILSHAAWVSAVAGDEEQAMTYVDRALSRLDAVEDMQVERYAHYVAAIVEAHFGDRRAAWEALRAMVRTPGLSLTEWRLADMVHFRWLFRDLPEYQEFLRELGRET